MTGVALSMTSTVVSVSRKTSVVSAMTSSTAAVMTV